MSAINNLSRLPEAHELGTHLAFIFLNAAISSEIVACIRIGHNRKNEYAKRYMILGIARRLRVIQQNYLALYEVIENDRKEPLNNSEQINLDLHLNSLYLHIRGVLDNLAWALEFEFVIYPLDLLQKTPQKIGLFNGGFISRIGKRYVALSQVLKNYQQWHEGMKTIRDPAAHRIPNYVAPSVLTPEEVLLYRGLESKANTMFKNGDFDGAMKVHDEIDGLGKFEPLFIDEIGNTYPMQFQIDGDIVNMILLIRAVAEEFANSEL
ncbi:MAG: hypothetical protein WBR15_10065 [Gammaproteobacteria bacterium]